jgi:RND family efflux transporter MFP subunit
VAGIILKQDFKEGSNVKKGEVLFHIDPAPFQAALAQAKADVASAEASLVDYEATLKRYRPLVKTGVITQQKYDTALANYKVAVAKKQAAVARVKTASLDLSYATVTAPISGRIGAALVTEGALVGEGEATPLARIKQMDPIYADVTQAVDDYLQIRSAMNSAEDGTEEPTVTLAIEDVDYTVEGRLLFSDVSVDRKTGQVSVRCEFPNKEGMLLPGMFVRIKIHLPGDDTALFVPQRAVTRAQDGTAQIYVVNDKGLVELRTIKTGEMQDNRWQVLKGLKAGERIVTTGTGKVQPGMDLSASLDAPKTKSEQ